MAEMDMKEKLVELQLKADIEDETSENTTQHREYIADLMIAHGVTVQEWIPVTERLPKHYTEVLLWDALDGERFLGHLDSKDNWKIPGYSTEFDWIITHWMPLPSTEGLE